MRSALVALSATLVFAVGCTPKIRVEWSRPAAFNLPPDVPVAIIVEKDGVQPTVNGVLDAVGDVTRGQVMNKWVAVEPVKQEFTAAFQARGYKIVDVAQAQAVVKLRPTGWDYALDEQKKDLRSGTGKLRVRVDIYDAKKLADSPLYSATYWGSGSAANIGEPEAMSRAARNVPGAFFRELTPQRVSASVELDDSDPLSETGIELCKQNKFEAAYQAFGDVVRAHPNNAPALYNYAVMAEVKGNYDQALSLLELATKIQQKPIYYSAIERVEGARGDAQAMASQQ